MFEACLPLGPCVTSKETFWPSLSVLNPPIWIAEKCANRSSLPSSGVIKPYPFASLNHFTVPVAIPHPSATKNGPLRPRLSGCKKLAKIFKRETGSQTPDCFLGYLKLEVKYTQA